MTALPVSSVLGKGMAVLEAFGADDDGLGFAEVQRRTGLPKATVHRTLQALVAARLLDQVDGRYHLGHHLFELGMRASVERRLIDVATPFLGDLYERTHEIAHLGLREGSEVVYVAKVGAHRQVRSPSRIGGRMPLHATAIGKALLAFLPEDEQRDVLAGPLARLAPRTITAPGLLRAELARIAEQGVAFEYEESAVGLNCVAAPVLDADDRVVAAVSATGPIARFKPRQHVDSVRAAAGGIAVTLARRRALEQRFH